MSLAFDKSFTLARIFASGRNLPSFYSFFQQAAAICETVKDDLEKMDGNGGRHQSSNNSPRIVEHPRTEPIHYSFFPFSPLDYIPYRMVCFL